MALVNLIVFLSIFLVLQPITATDSLSPFLAPFLDDLCKEVECGKGTCKASFDYVFNFICECDPGWKQTRYDEDKDLRFLPCVIPNCTLDYSCPKAPPPAPEIIEPPKNKSFFDPCYWAYCGEGSCSYSLKYGHRCDCNAGYANLLNVTAFPCFSQCVIGSDCESLGITASNDKAASTPKSAAVRSSPPGNLIWLMILIMPMRMVLWK